MDLQTYLTRPITDQEMEWLLQDRRYIRDHQTQATKYKNDDSDNGKQYYQYHTTEINKYKQKLSYIVLETKKAEGPLICDTDKCIKCKQTIIPNDEFLWATHCSACQK